MSIGEQTYKTNEELIKACLSNNRKAQEVLYQQYAPKMFAICKTYAKDRDEACEFLQLGFIKVFQKLDQFSFNGSFEGWIRRIIVTSALQELRKKKHYMLDVEEFADEVEEEVELKNVESLAFDKVIEFINELPRKAALVIKLYAVEGYSHKEIAEELGITVSTSKSQLNRARKLLNEKIESINV